MKIKIPVVIWHYIYARCYYWGKLEEEFMESFYIISYNFIWIKCLNLKKRLGKLNKTQLYALRISVFTSLHLLSMYCIWDVMKNSRMTKSFFYPQRNLFIQIIQWMKWKSEKNSRSYKWAISRIALGVPREGER